MHVEDTTSKEQMLREIILWASEVKNTSFLATFNNMQSKLTAKNQ